MVGKQDVENILLGMSKEDKKEVLDTLVLTILRDLTETEKRELLQTAVVAQKESHRLTAMVEH